MIQKQKRYKPLYKKLLRLRVNPLKNNKVLKFKRKKWNIFIDRVSKTKNFFTKYKPHTHYNYNTSKFASQGNSYKKKFKNDLIAKKSFNYFYGNLRKKYLKTHISQIYKSKNFRDPMITLVEFFESRLDSVIYRSKFSYSIKNAQQLITHKHVRVNNRIEKNKSYMLKQGDFIQIDKKSIELVKMNFEQQFIPELMKRRLESQLKIEKNELMKAALKKQIKELPDYFYPIPPHYLTINYNTLEILVGDIKNFNFSTYFPFKLNIYSIIYNYYRH